ncbi:hypothetical protein D7319_17085 [Streptomyces radicis]|uniref:Uncharacterized protein n=1 Tax=Streptomyces radicis TaxID=1750517 RepID=A0A3A9WJ89_9ACTN|nr:hypothetical protein D7319_17085 [Streptomyces radicis]RKN20748.1 hypothetical protein D7318_17835 [Streptomyces radicis]
MILIDRFWAFPIAISTASGLLPGLNAAFPALATARRRASVPPGGNPVEATDRPEHMAARPPGRRHYSRWLGSRHHQRSIREHTCGR